MNAEKATHWTSKLLCRLVNLRNLFCCRVHLVSTPASKLNKWANKCTPNCSRSLSVAQKVLIWLKNLWRKLSSRERGLCLRMYTWLHPGYQNWKRKFMSYLLIRISVFSSQPNSLLKSLQLWSANLTSWSSSPQMELKLPYSVHTKLCYHQPAVTDCQLKEVVSISCSVGCTLSFWKDCDTLQLAGLKSMNSTRPIRDALSTLLTSTLMPSEAGTTLTLIKYHGMPSGQFWLKICMEVRSTISTTAKFWSA